MIMSYIQGVKESSTALLMNARDLHYTYDRLQYYSKVYLYIYVWLYMDVFLKNIHITCIFIIELVHVLLDFIETNFVYKVSRVCYKSMWFLVFDERCTLIRYLPSSNFVPSLCVTTQYTCAHKHDSGSNCGC